MPAGWWLWHLPAFFLGGTVWSGWSFGAFLVGTLVMVLWKREAFLSRDGAVTDVIGAGRPVRPPHP